MVYTIVYIIVYTIVQGDPLDVICLYRGSLISPCQIFECGEWHEISSNRLLEQTDKTLKWLSYGDWGEVILEYSYLTHQWKKIGQVEQSSRGYGQQDSPAAGLRQDFGVFSRWRMMSN